MNYFSDKSSMYIFGRATQCFPTSRLPRYLTAVACSSLVVFGNFPQAASAQAASAAAPETKPAPVNGYAEQLKVQRRSNSSVVVNQPYVPIKKQADEGQIPEIEMFVGESRVFPSPGVGRIAVGNGSILTAAALDGKEIILFANAPGTSSLFVWNEDGRYQRVKINIVPGDTSLFAREIAAFLTTIPKAKASIIGDKVIVEGDDLTDTDLGRIELLSARYPQIVNFTNRLGFEQMVMLDVKVVEFPVSELRELGLRWNTTGGFAVGGIWSPIRRGNAGPYEISIATGQANQPPISSGSGGGSVVLPSGLNILSVFNMGLNATLNALAQEGKTTVLAEPQLSARNGSKASFLAGGEFPYTVSTINGPTIQFKPYGVKLDILPRVDRNGNIRATVETEISSIDTSVTTSAGPALLSNKTNTEFNVRNGETIVLSGLIQRLNSTVIDKVPGLGDIPVLGALFRSKRFQNKETELVVFVTPTVIDAKSPGVVDRIQKTNDRLQERLGPIPLLTDPIQPGVDPARLDRPVPATPAAPAKVSANENAETLVVANAQAKMQAQPVPIKPVETAPIAPASSSLSSVSFDTPMGSTLRVIQNGLTLFASPNGKSEALLQLGVGSVVTLRDEPALVNTNASWRPVQVGSLLGWVNRAGVEPTKLRAIVKPYQSAPALQPKSLGQELNPVASQSLTLGSANTKGRFSVLVPRLALRVTPDVNAPVLETLLLGQAVQGLAVEPRGAWTAVDAGGQRGWVATQWLQPVAEGK